MPNTPKISVQICSYNRRELLRRSLEALFRQDIPPSDYEIVLVDDGSTDGTAEMARSLAAPCRLKVLTKPNGGLARARNLGIKNAEGEIILFMDDDTFADPALLREHLATHAECPKCVVIGWVNHISELDPKGPRKVKLADLSNSFFWTSNVSVRKKYIYEAGLFDEEFTEYGWEDLELGYRLKKLGLERRINPRAIVSHYKRPRTKHDLPGAIRQAAASGRSALIYIRKRPGLRSRLATGITWPRMAIDRLLRPLEPVFRRSVETAADGPLTGFALFSLRMLASFSFFDSVRRGVEQPERRGGDAP